jgi:SAM-dependent methyltransferase
MTGLDFSPRAIEEARRFAKFAGMDATFVESDVYEGPAAVGAGRFDLVFTGVGALCWLPDIRRWAKVVADLLRPGGRPVSSWSA